MATSKTLLDGINEVLIKVHMIQGDSGALTTLTDSGRQTYIDLAVQVWNEIIDDLYASSNVAFPQEIAQSTIVIATSDRSYALAADMNQLRYPFKDETNRQYINEYPGGYMKILSDQPSPNDFTGLPQLGAINPEDGEFYLDRLPTSDYNGNTYKYWYDKDLVMTAAADTFPFKDVVFRALVPAVAELWKRYKRQNYDGAIAKRSMGRAMRYLTQSQTRENYGPTRLTGPVSTTDPYGDSDA